MFSIGQNEFFMSLALEQADVALKRDWIPVGAVFVNEHGDVVTHARKMGRFHAHFDHAEHNGCYQALWAGRNGPKDLQGITVYTTLEPCVMCMSMLLTTQVSHIVWGMEDSYGGGACFLRHQDIFPLRFRGVHTFPSFEEGCMREESRYLLKSFFLRRKEGEPWSNRENALVKACLEE